MEACVCRPPWLAADSNRACLRTACSPSQPSPWPQTRYVIKYRHCDGKLELKVTDDHVVGT